MDIRIAPDELQPGQYFKSNRSWFKARGTAKQAGPSVWQVPVLDRDGNSTWIQVYESLVDVAPAGLLPFAFRPAEIRRRADEARRKAEKLISLAMRLDELQDTQQREFDETRDLRR